eukprot:34738-Chlamydomonas_euryale.AAC.1
MGRGDIAPVPASGMHAAAAAVGVHGEAVWRQWKWGSLAAGGGSLAAAGGNGETLRLVGEACQQ